MLTIARLFGKSPFAPLQTHMNKVASCIELLSEIFGCLDNPSEIEHLVGKLSKMEHEADMTKNDIRNHLPKSLFLPIDRSHFLEILSFQDCIADKAEEIGLTLTLKPLEDFNGFLDQIQNHFKKVIDVFWSVKQIIQEIDELLESSFGGIEAEKVKSMVEQTAFKEHEVHQTKLALLKELFSKGDQLSNTSFYLWLHIIQELTELAHLSEKLANRVRMVLEVK